MTGMASGRKAGDAVIEPVTNVGMTLSLERYNELISKENLAECYAEHWPDCTGNQKRGGFCDCGYQVLFAATGQTGWGFPLTVTKEIEEMVVEVMQLTKNGNARFFRSVPAVVETRGRLRELGRAVSVIIHGAVDAAKGRGR